mgnify:CR=1 FL=1
MIKKKQCFIIGSLKEGGVEIQGDLISDNNYKEYTINRKGQKPLTRKRTEENMLILLDYNNFQELKQYQETEYLAQRLDDKYLESVSMFRVLNVLDKGQELLWSKDLEEDLKWDIARSKLCYYLVKIY